jgi:hypothetical protein
MNKTAWANCSALQNKMCLFILFGISFDPQESVKV